MDLGEKRKGQPNPRETASLFSVLFMTYSWGIFKKSLNGSLALEGLCVPLEHHRSQALGTSLESAWKKELCNNAGQKPSLMRALLRIFFKKLLYIGLVLLFVETCLRLCQPLLIGWMLQYFSSDNVSHTEALLYGTGIVITTAVYVIGLAIFALNAHLLALEMRAALSYVAYGKVLRLSASAVRNPVGGNIISLLSTDIKLFPNCIYYFHYTWASPLFIAVTTWVIWSSIGWAGVIGVVVTLVITTMLMATLKLRYGYRKKMAQESDKRIKIIDEIILGVRSIKMYAWEKPFILLVNMVRRAELKLMKKNELSRGIFFSFYLSTYRISCFAIMLAMAFFGDTFSANNVFTVAAFIASVSHFSVFLNSSYQEVSEAVVLIRRLEAFLLQEELSAAPHAMKNTAEDDILVLNNVTASWDQHKQQHTLSDINIQVKSGSLVVVIGPVGSGKTSLLHVILQELPILSGSFKVKGKLSYTSQEPWVFGATVRQNIIFTRPYQEDLYNRVVQACALQPDLLQLPRGDLTWVGERGCSLSGGQKARISLARAVYNEADVYLLDDPLSAVDTHVAKHLFEECIMTYLKGKTRLLVTHQLQYIKEADHIVVVKNGKIEVQGSFSDVTNNEFDIAKYLSSQERSVGNEDETTYCGEDVDDARGATEAGDRALEGSAETALQGTVKKSTYAEYFLSGSSYFSLTVIVLTFLLTQAAANGADYWMSYWTRKEEMKNPFMHKYTISSNAVVNFSTQDNLEIIPIREDWTSSREFCILVYAVIIVMLLLLSFVKVIMFFNTCEACSTAIHHQVMSSVLRTPITFFDKNPSGRLLDRFSSDMGLIDLAIPNDTLLSVQCLIQCIGILLLACIVNYWLLIVIVVLGVIFCYISCLYLASSTSLMRLEAECRSHVFVHMNATIQGLPTIRALKAQSVLETEFDRHQDLYTSATYTYTVASRAFSLYVDGLCFLYITCVVYIVLVMNKDSYAGNVGLVVTQCLMLLIWLQYGICRLAYVLENMTSVERLVEYKYLEEEANIDTTPQNSAPQCWPDKGCIVFQDVSLKYTENGPLVLENINIFINPGEKVGIVGRTGAGKSSFILALLRLAKVEGSILIDGIDTKDVSLHDLRKNISIIPQDPFLFSGTMRENLDRFGEFHDDELLSALEDVEMKGMLQSMDGLNTKVADKGDNFSVGQKQLLCLARAILKNNKILVLDEATANVDLRTDELIQKTLRTKFANCTVLTVAHRLNTIIDSDKVMVMDKGQLVEFDHPHLLLQNNESIFYKMVQKTGHLNNLNEIASESYNLVKQLQNFQ